MKKLIFMALAIVAFFACDSEDIPENINTDNGKEYIVNLGFSGEITIEQTPLTKSEGKDIYGIQVYSRHKDETEYKPYARGLFDNVSDMSIKLLGGYVYKFEATMVEDDYDLLYHDEKGYLCPFVLNQWHHSKLENKFIFSSDSIFTGISLGETDFVQAFTPIPFWNPDIKRYYGLLSDFDPESSNTAEIDMGIICFGVKYTVQDFYDGTETGTVYIKLGDSRPVYLTDPVFGSNAYVSFSHQKKKDGLIYISDEPWHIGDYNEDINVLIKWIKKDGTEIPLMNKDVNFVRNKMTHFIIKLNNNYSDINDTKTPINDSGISINIKEEPMLITDTLYVVNN